MTEDQFTQLFKYMKTGFDDVRKDMNTGFAANKSQINAVYDLLDKNISDHQRQEEERAAMAAQLTRLDRWIHEVASQTGVKLSIG